MTVEEWVTKYSKTRMKSFYPNLLAKELKISDEIISRECIKLKEQGKLELLYEVRCIKCLEILKYGRDINKIGNYFDETDVCMYCNNEIDFENNLIVLYEFIK